MTKPDPDKTIAFLARLSSHRVYIVGWVADELEACGFTIERMLKENGIIMNGHRIEERAPEWGEPGIYSLDLLSAAFQILTGQSAQSRMQGRGFWYDDVLKQLKHKLGKGEG